MFLSFWWETKVFIIILEDLYKQAMIYKTIFLKNSDNIPSGDGDAFPPLSHGKWVDKTLLHMGYPNLAHAREEIQSMVSEISVSVRREAEPKFLFKNAFIESFTKKGFWTKGLSVRSQKWGKLLSTLEGPEQVCCFALTLGPQVEQKIRILNEESVMLSFIWDSLCSILAEYYADKAELFIANQYKKKGLSITRRFSPGYCDLNLLQSQRALFNFCNPETIGIRISNSGFMIPRKSITGFVIAAKNVPLSSPCNFCTRKCEHRRISYRAWLNDVNEYPETLLKYK